MSLETNEKQREIFIETFVGSTISSHESDKLRALVREELENNDHIPDPAVSIDRLKQNERAFLPRAIHLARILLYLAALASAIWLLIPIRESLTLARLSAPGELLMGMVDHREHETSLLDDDATLLLYGDPIAEGLAATWRPLWTSDPDNPVWLSRYVAMCFAEDPHSLDADLLEKVSRIDPGNGFWHLIAACVDADDHLERVTIPESDDQPRKTEHHATDEEGILNRVARIHEAANMPELNSRQLDWFREALAVHPPSDGFASHIRMISWLASEILYGRM